jgi:hypothetical protein
MAKHDTVEITDDVEQKIQKMWDGRDEPGVDFSDWESEFIEDVYERYEQYGANLYLSRSQMDKVDEILDKIG